MEEIKALHSLTLEWGCITNLLDKIGNIEDEIDGGWPEMIDMVADAITQESGVKDPTTIFFIVYQFFFRLYYRLKVSPKKIPFNQYHKDDDNYYISNYNYDMFKWAIKNGFIDSIDNLTIKLQKGKLTDKQRRVLDRRCEKEHGRPRREAQ